MANTEIQRLNLDILIRNRGFKFTETFFHNAFGKIGPYYIWSDTVQKNGEDYAFAIKSVADIVEQIGGNEVISGAEPKDYAFSYPVASRLRRPHLTIRKDGKLEGAYIRGKKVIHVGDLNKTGLIVQNLLVPAIEGAGGTIKNIVFYIDGMEDGVQLIKYLKINSHCVVPMDKFALEYLHEQRVIQNEESRINLMSYFENRHVWAVNMLKSPKGIDNLSRLFLGNAVSRERAQNILDIGYPEIASELKEKLANKGLSFK